MSDPVKFSQAFQYHRPSNVHSARELVNDKNGKYRLRRSDLMFTVFTHNMALLPFPGRYLGTDRDGAIDEIIHRLAVEKPDLAGLCEVFVDDERERIRNSLSHIYPHFLEGPDEDDLESDGGLLLMCKSPILQSDQFIYRDCAGDDCLANKGILYMRIHPPQSVADWDIFYSHAQSMDPLIANHTEARNALYSQLSNLGNMIRNKTNLENNPAIVMGDLNIPAESGGDYQQLMSRLDSPLDLWGVKHPNLPGETYSANNNFYEDLDHVPAANSRLDYILLFPSNSLIPILDEIPVVNWTHNGRNISDHFGLFARFNKALKIERMF